MRLQDDARLEEVVVTAGSGRLSRLRSSVAVSALSAERIRQSVPANAADILRNVPGILAHASGGEGNANISVRGLPQSGGAKLVQFQEDGLPVLEFGDIEFATADTFLRADYTTEQIQVIRGGPAATFASNAPGGVVNFISRTGEAEAGALGLTRGLDFDRTRLDFAYGAPLDPDWSFHVGGFYRGGEGPRSIDYTAEEGGQIKGNVTRRFDNGYVRLDFKWLHDRAPVYLPVPVYITGSNSDPDVTSIAGFDVRSGAMQSPYFRHDRSVNRHGEAVGTDIADGYYSKSRAFGGEVAFDLGAQWRIEDRFRIAETSGRFVGPYAAEVNTAAALAESIGGAGSALQYATGPRAGRPFEADALAVRTHLFNTTLEDLSSAANDLRIMRSFGNEGSGAVHAVLGYYKSRQDIVMDWHWNTYLQQVRGKRSALLDVVGADGSVATQNGLVAYGEPFWGNCCVRFYDLRYDTDAPYLALGWERGALNLDASIRYDISRAEGSYAAATGTTAFDVNGDSELQVPEQAVPIVDEDTRAPVDYTVEYLSYSAGANYLLSPDFALFVRTGRGGRANATRLLFGGGIRPDGEIAKRVAVNEVLHYEGGAKWQGTDASLLATLFYARTEVTDQDITEVTERFTDRTFEARGVELEGEYRLGRLTLNGGLTLTWARVARDEITPEKTGMRVNQRAAYQLAATYSLPQFSAGVNVIGTSGVPVEQFVIPEFTQVNAFLTKDFTDALSVSVLANNLFHSIGITEVPNAPAGVTANGLNTARSIEGRTIAMSFRYSF